MMSVPEVRKWGTLAPSHYTTTDAYAAVPVDPEGGSSVLVDQIETVTTGPLVFVLENLHGSNSITVRLYGLLDRTDPPTKGEELQAASAIAGNGVLAVTVPNAVWPSYLLQAKSTTPGSAGILKARVAQKVL